jgi:DNA-directed RNA polymerase specialized sigma24 family protein
VITVDSSPDMLLEQSAFVHRLAASLLRDAHLAQEVAQDALMAGLQQDGDRAASARGWLAAAVTAVPRQLHGRVLDHGGAPLAVAELKLEPGERSRQVAAERDGAFTLTDVYTDLPVRLVASLQGHAA